MAKDRDICVIRQELRDIRYYNTHKKEVLKGLSNGIGNDITKIVELYTDNLEHAPIKLYRLYLGLYVDGHTQYSLANEWGYTSNYIKKLNNELCQYFLNTFNAKGVS